MIITRRRLAQQVGAIVAAVLAAVDAEQQNAAQREAEQREAEQQAQQNRHARALALARHARRDRSAS